MPTFIKSYGDCTGPFGFPMKEADARELDTFLSEHSKESALGYKHRVKSDAYEYFIDGERADVSKVTDSSVDKAAEIVKADGVDWSIFQKNPVVTLQHCYWIPPLGKSVWQKRVGDAWKAKSIYADRPDDLPKEKEWAGDTIWHLIKSGFLKGKSIGFMPQKWHEPTREEISKDFTLKNVDLIFDEVKVYEYAVCSIGCNDNATVEDVAKSMAGLPEELSTFFPELQKLFKVKTAPEEKVIDNVEMPKGFKVITVDQYKTAIRSKIGNALAEIKKECNPKDIIDRLKGKV